MPPSCISINMNDLKILRRYIRESLRSLISHSAEPKIGNMVVNTNPGCKHYRSSGHVMSIDALDDDAGKTITYLVSNDGENFSVGDILTKTFDQVRIIR